MSKKIKTYFKEVKVGTKKINCNFTLEMLEDLKNMMSMEDVMEEETRVIRKMQKEERNRIIREKIKKLNRLSDES